MVRIGRYKSQHRTEEETKGIITGDVSANLNYYTRRIEELEQEILIAQIDLQHLPEGDRMHHVLNDLRRQKGIMEGKREKEDKELKRLNSQNMRIGEKKGNRRIIRYP